jgi:penicillin amidase
VHSKRILKLINLSIAVLILVVLSAVLWFAWRPLAKTSGTIEAPISQSARIGRDRFGVPHIAAATLEDAIFLQGFVTAQDRMWQMDGIRRLAAGELSEVIGKNTLEVDKDARRLRMRRVAHEQAQRLSPADRAVMAAYARGVNFYLEQNRGKYPVEFALLGYDPRPWTVEDCALAGLQMFLNLTNTWRDDLNKMALLEGGDRSKVEFLFPLRTGAEPQPGSNAWAVSGAHTASGRPILANDPHLEFGLPSTWYMVHLMAPGLNVTGVSLPGLPCVIIGHNERIAWGVTNLHYDVQDVYREQLNPQTGLYPFRGQMEQARIENDVIAVKGEKAVPFQMWVTRHGPVLQNEANQFLAVKWTAAEPGGFEFPMLDVDRANNWQEFTAALARFTGPGQNFVYADVEGNIGYHATGKLPIRKTYAGDVPVDGSSGEFEWEGYIPFDQLPSFYNPPSGLVVTANQNPFPADYRYRVNGGFASHYRSRQIRTLLSQRDGWKPDQILAVQKDVYSGFGRFLAQQTASAYDRRKPSGAGLADAVGVLRNWDGQMDKDSSAAMLAELLYVQVRQTLAERAAPKKGAAYSSQMAPAVIERILRERPAGWFPDYDEMLMVSLSAAIADGAKRQGSSVQRWHWGAQNQLTIAHPVLGQLPLIGAYFNIGPVWMSGSSTTVKQTTRRLGPSMRMVVDLSNLDGSYQNITIGESGQALSSHYKDEWASYYVGNGLPMQFGKVEVKAELVVDPVR